MKVVKALGLPIAGLVATALLAAAVTLVAGPRLPAQAVVATATWGLAAVAIGAPLGLLLATLAFSTGRRFSALTHRVLELTQAAPPAAFMLAAVAIDHVTLAPLVLALSVCTACASRSLRKAEKLEREPFITASIALGASRAHVLRRHVWPTLVEQTSAAALAAATQALALEAALGLLGASHGLSAAAVDALRRGDRPTLWAAALLAAAVIGWPAWAHLRLRRALRLPAVGL